MQYVVLAAIAVAAVVIGIDAARQRIRLRNRPNVYRALAASVSAPTVEADIAELVADAIRSDPVLRDEELGGVWQTTEAILDPTRWRPKLATGVEVRTFHLRWGDDYALIANPDHDSFFKLEQWEAELVGRMDGSRSVDELIVERLQEGGELDPGAVAGLVEMLRVEGLLDPRAVDLASLVADRLDRASPGRRKLREFGKSLKIGWSGAERMTRGFYGGGLRFAFRPAGVILCSLLAVGGLVAIVATVTSHRFVLQLRAAPVEVAILITLSFVLTFFHELAHALVLVHYDRRVISSGFMIFFGSPAFYVDASDIQMADRRQRVTQSFAGPWAELVLAGVASIFLFLFPGVSFGPLLYRFAVINYFVIFENLIPLLRLDGYWILCDVIEEPDLRGTSIAFIQRDLWHLLKRREHLSMQHVGLALYGVVGVAYSLFSVWIGVYFWQRLFGGLVRDLWDGGPASRILLIILFLAFLGPVIRALIDGGRALYRRTRALVTRIVFRLERSWRVEAAELIDALPGFDDLPEDVLSDLAGRVRLRTFPPGRVVIRQGDRPTAFYVVRSGEVSVEESDPVSADTRVLRTLGRGEAFGEMGLLTAAPRQATVRASSSAQLFEVDKGSFDRLLADSVAAPNFAPTMQAFAELRALPPFARLATDQLEVVLEHGDWAAVAPGVSVIEQGDVGDAFFVIGSGQADVVQDGYLQATLGPGEYFGEVALLRDAPRNATVRARTPLRTFRLDRAGFEEVIADDIRRGPGDESPRTRDMEH